MYIAGFGNHHMSEAIQGALPSKQNSPQNCNFGLYAEQLSGSAFTRPRALNLHSWLYRILPSVVHKDYRAYPHAMNSPFAPLQAPNPMRWSPLAQNTTDQDFVDGLFHIAGSVRLNTYLYQCNLSMVSRYFSNNDGELLFVPYKGRLQLCTEFGKIDVSPGMIAVIPRGVHFQMKLIDAYAEGYLCENGGIPLTLPQLGPIGANGLASPRHFLYPIAAFEETKEPVHLICKNQQQLWIAETNHSPLNVVAWHGNYAPYCYDLSLFNTINTVSFDHPDPSIFTVLTSASEIEGAAHFDFVIFPPRWMVAETTFRPPYFHRNVMNELMGLIQGEYDAKQTGFSRGGFSIHNRMTAHGPDTAAYLKASNASLEPEHYDDTLAFMFESYEPWLVTEASMKSPSMQNNYSLCWQKLRNNFNPDTKIIL